MPKNCRIKLCIFEGFRCSILGWNLTGAVTFFESPVTNSNSKFEANRSEDSLNIIRSNFKINDSSFSQTQSDALDIDFGVGTIQNSNFIGIGNDAIDISGTKLTMKNIYINNAGDKAISITSEKSDYEC